MVSILSQYCINVTDLERSVAFWRDVMGIPEQSRTDIPGAREVVRTGVGLSPRGELELDTPTGQRLISAGDVLLTSAA